MRARSSMEAGKSAGIIALDANPLDDINNTRRISAFYCAAAPWTGRRCGHAGVTGNPPAV